MAVPLTLLRPDISLVATKNKNVRAKGEPGNEASLILRRRCSSDVSATPPDDVTFCRNFRVAINSGPEDPGTRVPEDRGPIDTSWL